MTCEATTWPLCSASSVAVPGVGPAARGRAGSDALGPRRSGVMSRFGHAG